MPNIYPQIVLTMGKSRKVDKKRGPRDDHEEESDAMATREDFSDDDVASQGAYMDSVAGTAMSADLSEEFPQQVDNLTDSSGPKRIKAIMDILQNLKAGVDLSAYVLNFREDIVAGIVWILRRHQMESECVLAMQLGCIFALVVGANEDGYYTSLQDALMFAATRRYISMAHFVCFIDVLC